MFEVIPRAQHVEVGLFGGAGPDWFWIAASSSATDQLNNVSLGDVVTFQ